MDEPELYLISGPINRPGKARTLRSLIQKLIMLINFVQFLAEKYNFMKSYLNS